MPPPPPSPYKEQGDVRAWIVKLLRGPGIEFKESIPPAYGARLASSTTLFLISS